MILSAIIRAATPVCAAKTMPGTRKVEIFRAPKRVGLGGARLNPSRT